MTTITPETAGWTYAALRVLEPVRDARARYEKDKQTQRHYL